MSRSRRHHAPLRRRAISSQSTQGTYGGGPAPLPNANDLESVGSSLPGQPLYDEYLRIGGGVTPRTISEILRQADQGYTYRLVDLGNECRQKDATLQCVLHTRETALGALSREVIAYREPGAKDATPEDEEIATEFKAALDGCKGIQTDAALPCVGVNELLTHLQGAPFWGYANAETVWGVGARGRLVPKGFYCHSPRRFGFRIGDGKLVHWDQVGTVATGVQTVVQERYPGRWLQHQPRINGDVKAREGLCRMLIWPALYRNWDVGSWMKLAELAWRPWRIGRFSRKSTKEEQTQLRAMLRGMSADGVLALSEGIDVAIQGPKDITGNGTNHRELAEFMGQEMSKAVLGGTLIIESGDRGARSLGEVHERGFDAIVQYDAGCVASTIERDLAYWYVRLNYGPDRGVPTVLLTTQDEADLDKFATALKGMQDAGMKIPRRWAHEQAGVPQPAADEAVLDEPTEDELAAAAAEKPETETPIETPVE